MWINPGNLQAHLESLGFSALPLDVEHYSHGQRLRVLTITDGPSIEQMSESLFTSGVTAADLAGVQFTFSECTDPAFRTYQMTLDVFLTIVSRRLLSKDAEFLFTGFAMNPTQIGRHQGYVRGMYDPQTERGYLVLERI